MDFIYTLQQLFTTMDRQFGEKPTYIVVSPELKNKIIDSRANDPRFLPVTTEEREQILTYHHMGDTIKFVTSKEEIE